MKPTATKKRRIVGTRERLTKATTNLVRSLAPRTFRFRSKISLTRFRMTKKDQEENQDDVDIDQAEDDDIVGDGDFPSDLGEFHLNGRKDKDEDGDDPDDDQLIASSFCVRGKFFLHLINHFNPSAPLSQRGEAGFLRRERLDHPIGFKIPQGDEKEEILEMKRKPDRIQFSLDSEVRGNSGFKRGGRPDFQLSDS